MSNTRPSIVVEPLQLDPAGNPVLPTRAPAPASHYYTLDYPQPDSSQAPSDTILVPPLPKEFDISM